MTIYEIAKRAPVAFVLVLYVQDAVGEFLNHAGEIGVEEVSRLTLTALVLVEDIDLAVSLVVVLVAVPALGEEEVFDLGALDTGVGVGDVLDAVSHGSWETGCGACTIEVWKAKVALVHIVDVMFTVLDVLSLTLACVQPEASPALGTVVGGP